MLEWLETTQGAAGTSTRHSPTSNLRKSQYRPLLEAASSNAEVEGYGLYDVEAALSQTEYELVLHRLARLLTRAWDDGASRRIASRPDALRIACECLAKPTIPSSFRVSTFIATQELRRRYAISFDPPTQRQLEKSFQRLRVGKIRSGRGRPLIAQSPTDHFILDILCLGGWYARSGTVDALRGYYNDFAHARFGVDGQSRMRLSYTHPEACTLPIRRSPTFSELTTFIFGQPTGVSGLDFVTGGILAPFAGEEAQTGLVTLIAGPPGSGKTNLSLAVSYRMSELGSSVRYLAVEEAPADLVPRVLTTENLLTSEFAPYVSPDTKGRRTDFSFVIRRRDESLPSLIDRINQDFRRAAAMRNLGNTGEPAVPLPLVLVIDSLTTLLERRSHDEASSALTKSLRIDRRGIAEALEKARRAGICVLLVGSETDPAENGLAYLVDNVLDLGFETDAVSGHIRRTVTVKKTRLQSSLVGRHTFRITSIMGCMVIPSLSAWLSSLEESDIRDPVPTQVRVLLPISAQVGVRDRPPREITLRDNAHVLVSGYGSAGKARYALSIVFEPAVPLKSETLLESRSETAALRNDMFREALGVTRVLVISFLYEPVYYEEHVIQLLQRRFGIPAEEAQNRIDNQLDVIPIPAGFTDAASIIARIDESLMGAHLDGRPFTGVVIDGVHNLLVQFPQLELERLFLPTLLRLLRARPLTVVTTFTHFTIPQLEKNKSDPRQVIASSPLSSSNAVGDSRDHSVSHDLFYHLLVSRMDYSLTVQRPSAGQFPPNERCVRVEIQQSIEYDRFTDQGYWWDVKDFRAMPDKGI
jgi:KaiC/GvpD/RAD55 family RecA-like ATPase